MMPQIATKESSFSLVYGVEAVIPTKIQVPTLKSFLSKEENSKLMALSLDFLEEKREQSLIRIA